jgi:nondiscriminating glutamyl-tRNA synthetase
MHMKHTRIAPSPSGHFHLGTARTAYFNWLAARATGGTFLLRIDDTNTEKSSQEFVDVIYRAMDYLGMDFDLTFKQSDRQDRYNAVIDMMVAAGKAVHRDGAVFLTHTLEHNSFDDLALKNVKSTKIDIDFIANMVLRKSDGMPTYHFANVVDDIDHGINLIIRGNDHTNNTMKQIALYEAIHAAEGTQVRLPQYAHVGLLCDLSTGKKLSKSDGATSLLDYQAQGVDRDAMLNFLLRLGWGPKVDDATTTLLPTPRAMELFLTAGNLRGQHSKVDFAKLANYDKKYKAAKAKALVNQ